MIGASNAVTPPSAPMALTNAARPGFSGMNTLSLEPTMVLTEMDHYLHYLQQLRRTNEGDDSKDSPGYSLDLVGFPFRSCPAGRPAKVTGPRSRSRPCPT